jgi:hypothetical protein
MDKINRRKESFLFLIVEWNDCQTYSMHILLTQEKEQDS